MPKSTGRKRKQRETEQREHLRNDDQENRSNQNVGEIERAISSALGGALLIGGLSRRSLPGLAIAATGAAFLFRGTTGYCKVYEALGLDTYRETVDSYHSVGLPHETARWEDSIGENQPTRNRDEPAFQRR